MTAVPSQRVGLTPRTGTDHRTVVLKAGPGKADHEFAFLAHRRCELGAFFSGPRVQN